MVCTAIRLPTGETAIVCGPKARRWSCASCGKPAALLCDWKVAERKSGTCDAPICAACSTSPAPGKDLCQDHARAWREWQAASATRE